jgi:Fic family protein
VNLDRFRASPVGRLVPIVVTEGSMRWEHEAFVPDPLPTSLDLSRSTWLRVLSATSALTRLDGSAGWLPNPYLLVRPSLAEEAVSTSALEGTYASIQEVFQAELLEDHEVEPAAAEVRNYIDAAELGLRLIDEIPICLRLVTDVHGALMRGARGDSWETGRFRARQNWIGRRGDTVVESQFVPPPEGEPLESGLRSWEEWVNQSSDLPVLVRVALAHYQFETLHPFVDGNGRVGRLVAVLMFISSGELKVPLLNLSPFLEQHKDEYVDHLQEVSATGDFEPWIRFFAETVRVQSERALSKAERLTRLHRETMQTVHEARVRGVALRIADDSISSPVVTPSRAAERYGVSYEAANQAVARLVELELLTELTGRAYRRMFAFPAVFDVLTRDETPARTEAEAAEVPVTLSPGE